LKPLIKGHFFDEKEEKLRKKIQQFL